MDERKRKRREETLRRPDSTEEPIGHPATARDPDEDERQRVLENKVVKEPGDRPRLAALQAVLVT